MNKVLNDYDVVDNLIKQKKIQESFRYFNKIKFYHDESLNQLYRVHLTVLNKRTITTKQWKLYFDYFERTENILPSILENFYSVAGDYFFERNEFGQAINQYQKCLEYNGVNTHAILGQAKSYQILGMDDKSEEKYVQILHLYDWNTPMSEDLPTSDSYSTLEGFLENFYLGHVPNEILIDLGIFYLSKDTEKSERIFNSVVSNSKKSENHTSSYFFAEVDPFYNKKNHDAQKEEMEISRDVLIDKISKHFPEFNNKFKNEIELGNFRNNVLSVDIEFENDSTQKFKIKYTENKSHKIYSIVPQEIEINEYVTSVFYLHLIDPKKHPLEKFFKSIKFEIIQSGKLTKYEILKFFLRSIGDTNSLFLLEKYRGISRPSISYSVKAHQAIKEINQKCFDVEDVFKSLQNNEHSLDIFLDSLKDYFALVRKDKSYPLDDFDFELHDSEITEYLERMKKRKREKIQSKEQFLKKGYDPMQKLRKMDETWLKLRNILFK